MPKGDNGVQDLSNSHKQVPLSTKNSSPGGISSLKQYGVQLNRRGIQVD